MDLSKFLAKNAMLWPCSSNKWLGRVLWDGDDRGGQREESEHRFWAFPSDQHIIVSVWQQIPHGGLLSTLNYCICLNWTYSVILC